MHKVIFSKDSAVRVYFNLHGLGNYSDSKVIGMILV